MRKRMVHVPLILQMEEMEGGAACLTMVLGHYRKQVSQEQVRTACGISRDGIRPGDIVRAGRSFGLDCEQRNCTAGELEEGQGSVGIKMTLSHIAATPLGMKVWCETELTEIDRKRLVFTVEAYDEAGKIAEGIHERFIVDNEKFLSKAEQKKSGT